MGIVQIRERFLGLQAFLHGHTICVLVVLFSISAAILAWHLFRFTTRLIQTASLQGANLYSEVLRETRTLYTSDVVERVRAAGVPVTHDYLSKKGAIPLPATFSMELARRIGHGSGGMKSRLYSDYPFPWRKTEGGPKDAFERDALDYLRHFPEKTFYRFENFQGRPSLRFATADRMRPSCIACHNTLPTSPKKDWKVGDVRGVLEIIRPLDSLIAQSRQELRATYFVFGAIGSMALLSLALIILRLQNINVSLEQSVQERATETIQAQKLASLADIQFHRQKELNEFKTKLVSLVSHEFGNALTVIQNATFILEERDTPQQLAQNEHLYQMIMANTQMLNGVVNNLLGMDRIEAGKLVVTMTQTNLADIIRNTAKRLEIISERKNVHVSSQIPDIIPYVKADDPSLSLVISNLLINAIKYTPNNGHVAIGVAEDAAHLGFYRVYVQDTGIGISKDDLQKIFSGYYRTKSGQKMTSKGFGIGLSLTKQIIEAHGSSLEVETHPGKGSRFSFLLQAWPGLSPVG